MSCIVHGFVCIFVIHTSRYKIVLFKIGFIMKNQINKLKIAALSIGFLSFASCTGDVTIGSASANTSFISNSIEMVQKNLGESIISRTSVNLRQQTEAISGSALPIFFGTIEATLVSVK